MDLEEWAAVLDRAAADVLPEGKRVVDKGALNIKNDWRDRWKGHAHFPDLPRAVTYDSAIDGMTVRAQIGPDKGLRQGALGNLIEFGSRNNAPIPGGLPALDAEEPRFRKAVADLGGKLLSGH